MTPADLRAVESKFRLSDATRRRNLGAGGVASPLATCGDDAATSVAPALGDRPARPIRVRQRTKPLLNKLETEFRDRLRVTGVDIWEQAITFRLGNGVRYTPDLALYSDMGTFCCYEVKGPWSTDDAIVKFKMAATMYPKVHWIMVWKDDAGQWQTQEAQP